MLRLCVDSRDTLRDPRGIGRYVREVLRRFAASDEIDLQLLTGAALPLSLRKSYRTALGSNRFTLKRSSVQRCDVSWHPWNGIFFQKTAPAVATVHDVVPFAYPDPDSRKRSSQQAPFLRAARASALLTDSKFSAGEIAKHLGVPAFRITVVSLGVDRAFTPGAASPPPMLRGARYVLALATAEPHKNLATLLDAFGRAELPSDVVLAVRGGLRESSRRVVALDALDEEALRGLYRGALFVAIPSLYEGFGLPALEAMACGAPVLASRAGALPEVCGEAAAYVDDPTSVDAWARAIAELVRSERRRDELRARGVLRATSFTWDATAAATLSVLRACAQEGAERAIASAARS